MGNPIKSYRQLAHNGSIARLHRIRAERALGHPLPPKAVVHHADGTRSDTSPLVICQDDSYHKLLHRRMRVKAAGGNPNLDEFCKTCEQVKPAAAFRKERQHAQGRRVQCYDCRNTRRRELWRASRERADEAAAAH